MIHIQPANPVGASLIKYETLNPSLDQTHLKSLSTFNDR